jgi:quinol monooxygenase YgiN
VLIASLSFDVRPDKRTDFVSAVHHVVETLRWCPGCLGCRLMTDCENPSLFTLSSEWVSPELLERHLVSPEFQILEDTRVLLRDGPGLSIDEVVSRGRPRGPLKHAR